VIRSMTGFGDASAEHDGVHYFLEVRSLNGKYFKATIRLPDDLQGLEPELESELRRRLTRGTITLVGKGTDASAGAAQEINHEALERYVEQLRAAPSLAGGSISLDAGSLLGLPGVLQSPRNEEERLDSARAALLGLVAEACDHVLSMRAREGALLDEDLRTHHAAIGARLEEIRVRAPEVVTEYESRLRGRVETMLADAGLAIEPVDLIREIAVYAERSDVSEEVARLTGHLQQFEALLDGDHRRPIGRTMDFLAQEMLREANTIASKSGDAAISRAIVEIKGAIDRIKEQAQNVE
jgi:uncharacterized protein (TIGR00255 family)